jgi:NAD(P)-dependent dehydrogenase (short-subunit alcohol dehydrogenase family)
LDGQVALVTGGATGIGKEICRVLGAHGAKVAMASRKRENLEAAVEELATEGIDAQFAVCDVRDAEAVRAAVDQILESRHRLDIVVNNAAGNFPAPMSKISPNGFKAVVDIDLLGTYNVTRFGRPRRFHRQHQRALWADGRRLPVARCGGQGWSRFAHPDVCRRVGALRHPGQCHRPRVDRRH